MKLGEAFVEIRADDAKLRAALSNAEAASKKSTGVISSGFMSIGNSILGLSAQYAVLEYAVSRAFNQMIAPVKEAYTAVEDFQGNIVRTAALISSFQKEGDLATNFKEAKDYAASLAYTMYDIDAKSIAGAKDLQLMTQEFIKQGVVLDNNNQRQMDAFTNIANAVAVIAEGYGAKEIQVRQETRALLLGEVRATNQLAMQIDAMIGGGLKQMVEKWKEQKTIVENVGELLKGYGAAIGDFEQMWAAIGSTMESIKNRILVEGFTPIYRDINANLIRMNAYIKEHASILGGNLLFAARSVQGIFESLRNLLVPFADPLKLAAGFVIQIVAGLGMVAYTILPPLTERVGHFLKSMVDIVFAAGNLGKVLWDVASLNFEAAVEDLKAAKSRWGDAGVEVGKTFGGGFEEEVVRRYNEMVATLNTPGKVKAPKLDGVGDKETPEEQIQVLKTRLGERVSAVKSYADLENELEKVNLASKEILWKKGLAVEDSYLQAKNRLEEEAALATLDSLKQQLEETQSTYDQMIALAEGKGKREKLIADQSKATASIRDEITKTNIDLLLLEKTQELDAIDRQKRLAEARKAGVLDALEQQIKLTNQLYSLQSGFGLASPSQVAETEIRGQRELLQLQLEHNRERLAAGGLTVAEEETLRTQIKLNELLLSGEQSLTAEGLKRQKALQDTLEIERQRLQSQYKYGQDVAELTGNFREFYDLQVKSLEVERQRALEKVQNVYGYTQRDLDSVNKYYDLLEKRLENMKNPAKAFGQGWEDAVRTWRDEGLQMAELARSTATSMQQSFSDIFFDVMQGKLVSFGDYVKSFLASIERAVADSLARSLVGGMGGESGGWLNSIMSLVGLVGGVSTGGGGMSGWQDMSGGTIAVAHGAAFGSGGVYPFKRGGVVSSPTIFPFAKGTGLMGENGDEGILPLARTSSGDLGVKTSGKGSGDVHVHFDNVTISAVDAKSFYELAARNPGAMINPFVETLIKGGQLRSALMRVLNK